MPEGRIPFCYFCQFSLFLAFLTYNRSMGNLITKSELYHNGLNAMGISRLVNSESLGNFGFGYYTDKPSILKFENDKTMLKINALLDDYPLMPKRVVFSSISLNFCINQLLSQTTYVVEIEKGYIESVFEMLKVNFNNVVLIKPSKQDKYNYWKPEAIYVTELFSRSPVNKNGTITIEKLIVDLLFDEDIYSLYSGKDIEQAVYFLCSGYTINYKTMLSYAARRGKREQLLARISKIVPDVILGAINRGQ